MGEGFHSLVMPSPVPPAGEKEKGFSHGTSNIKDFTSAAHQGQHHSYKKKKRKRKRESPFYRGFFMGCILQSRCILRPRTSLWCMLTMKGRGVEYQLFSRGPFFPYHAAGCSWQTSHKPDTSYDGWQTLGYKQRRSTSKALVRVRAQQ